MIGDRRETLRFSEMVAERLGKIEGVEAVALGGSWARGEAHPNSDVDLGIYYRPGSPPRIEELRLLARELDDCHPPEAVTDFGEWGPWINGGGWLTVRGIPVDLLYRDLQKVSTITADCQRGRIGILYQPGHPHGFTSYIYMAEIALCQPLWDPHGTLAALKAQTTPYSPLLKQAIIDKFHWEADFSLKVAHKSVDRGDVAYAAGCCFRCVACLLQTLFALNEQYWMNEKGAVALAATFPHRPPALRERVDAAFSQLDASSRTIAAAVDMLGKLARDVDALLAEIE